MSKVKFLMLSGEVVYAESFMKGPSLQHNRHWRNMSDAESDHQQWQETVGEIETVDPNTEYLFGYESKAFMLKQYTP